jgi:hypothetical protein
MDTKGKICLYNSKESHKIAKLNLDYMDKSYKISYFNKHQISFTEGKKNKKIKHIKTPLLYK